MPSGMDDVITPGGPEGADCEPGDRRLQRTQTNAVGMGVA
jgi:hypothetical protein